jgi:hypothetical protein
MSDFLEQYKANCRSYVRRTPYRLLRLLVAFAAALVLAPICALAARLTGEPMVAFVVGVAGALGVLAIWILIERAFQSGVQGPDINQSNPAQFSPESAIVTPELVQAGQPPTWQPAAPPPAKSSSGGCTIALLAVAGVLMLSCCGGGVALFAVGSSIAGHANGRVAVQEDPFFDLQRRQERQIEDLVRRQQDHWREIERDHQRIGQGPGW